MIIVGHTLYRQRVDCSHKRPLIIYDHTHNHVIITKSWPLPMSKWILWFHAHQIFWTNNIIWDYHGDLFPLYCWLLNRLKMLDIMRQNWTTEQKFFDQVVMAGAMFAQYISRSKDQHRVFVHSGQSSQIHTGWDVIQALFLSSNIKSCNLSEHTWDLPRPAVAETFSWFCDFFRKQRENFKFIICTSWIIYARFA